MSLHLGNLSSHVRRDELERVFRRFGRCNLQVKDKFGFVVYDYPVNAERALKTLRGKEICGEQLTLSWSNRQPRPLPRARCGRYYDSQRGRNSMKENYVSPKLSSDSRKDFRIGYKKPDAAGRIFSPTEPPEDATDYDPDNAKDGAVKEELSDEGGGPSQRFVEDDRWGEQIGDRPNGNGLENGLDFDRYEPYSGDDRRDEDEIDHAVHRGGSPAAKDFQHRNEEMQIGNENLDQFVTAKTQQACYNCGEVGHKMRNCPQERVSRKKLNKLDRRRKDKSNYSSKGEEESKRVESESRGRQRHSRDAVTIRSRKGNREPSSSRNHHQFTRTETSPANNRTHGSRGKESERVKRMRESVIPRRHRARKSRRQLSSPILSDDKASRFKPQSKNPKSGSRFASHSSFRSRSVSSSYSTSSSKSHSSRSRNRSKSGLRLGSRSQSSSSASLYLSTSSGPSSQPSPSKLQIDQDSLTKTASRTSQLVDGDASSDKPKLDTGTAVENGNEVVQFQVDKDMDTNHSQKSEKDSHLDEGLYLRDPMFEKGGLTNEISSPTSQRGTRDIQISDFDNHESEVGPHKTTKKTRITSEEMLMVIKHYGLKQPEGVDKDLAVESVFGSARLWPWEIIYYRRLKKGPISVENYARRIDQNKEFEIVDKYVRSSSGWDELDEDDF